MYKFFKMQYIAVLTGIILAFLCVAPCCAVEIDTLTMLSGDVSHNMEDVSPKSVLQFNFNHRLDHCDNDFSITGGDVTVTGWNIKGTQLTVSLSKSLAYDTQYTLSLTGLSDIYFEEYSTPTISFKTKQLELKSQRFTDGASDTITTVNAEATLYTAQLINYGEQTDVWMAMTLTETDSGRMEDVIFKKITLKNGVCTINEGFTNIGDRAEDYTVKVFFLTSPETLVPYSINTLQPVTLPGKSDS